MTQAKASNAPAYVARPDRWECDIAVMMRDDCGRQIAGRLANLSENGFMAECEEKMPKGAEVEVDIPHRGLVRAEIRWVLGWRFGARIL